MTVRPDPLEFRDSSNTARSTINQLIAHAVWRWVQEEQPEAPEPGDRWWELAGLMTAGQWEWDGLRWVSTQTERISPSSPYQLSIQTSIQLNIVKPCLISQVGFSATTPVALTVTPSSLTEQVGSPGLLMEIEEPVLSAQQPLSLEISDPLDTPGLTFDIDFSGIGHFLPWAIIRGLRLQNMEE